MEVRQSDPLNVFYIYGYTDTSSLANVSYSYSSYSLPLHNIELYSALHVAKLTILCKAYNHFKYVCNSSKTYSKHIPAVNLAFIISYDHQISRHCCIVRPCTHTYFRPITGNANICIYCCMIQSEWKCVNLIR